MNTLKLEGLNVQVELDRTRRQVILHMLEFDSVLVAEYLSEVFPFECGVRLDNSLFEHVLTLPLYGLTIALAGRRHPAYLRHTEHGVSVRLGDPDAEYLKRCFAAIEQLLHALSVRKIEAVVPGIDRHGRPEPDGGYLHLLYRSRPGHDAEVESHCKGAKQEQGVDIVSFPQSASGLAEVRADESHFVWECSRVTRKNWARDV